MSEDEHYAEAQPSREDVDALRGPVVLDFGTDWCGYCRASRSPVDTAFAGFPQVRHLRVEDGPGRPLGRSFRVKLWPTLVFLRDGLEVRRLVRPVDAEPVRAALEALVPDSPPTRPSPKS